MGITAQLDSKELQASFEQEEHLRGEVIGAGGGGSTDHGKLTNRNAKDQHPISAITGLEDALGGKSPSDHTHTASDVGARPDTWMPTASDVGARPATWTPTAEEVGARSNTWIPTAAEVGARPSDWMPTASDVGARSADWLPTADEIGARSNTWMPTASDVGARPNTWMPTAEEVGARPNTWLPTIADIGAAPSGYGLGETPRKSKDINAENLPSYFSVTSATANTNELQTYGAGHVRVYDSNRIVQNVFRVANGCELVRYTNDGGATWIEEWVNPPMVLGTEYRTTERWQGKAVYTKLVNYGSLPASGSKDVIHTANGIIAEVIAWHGTYAEQALPNPSFDALVTPTMIRITVSSDLSAYTAQIAIKYTKR